MGRAGVGAQHDASQVVLRPLLRDGGVQLRVRTLLGTCYSSLQSVLVSYLAKRIYGNHKVHYSSYYRRNNGRLFMFFLTQITFVK